MLLRRADEVAAWEDDYSMPFDGCGWCMHAIKDTCGRWMCKHPDVPFLDDPIDKRMHLEGAVTYLNEHKLLCDMFERRVQVANVVDAPLPDLAPWVELVFNGKRVDPVREYSEGMSRQQAVDVHYDSKTQLVHLDSMVFVLKVLSGYGVRWHRSPYKNLTYDSVDWTGFEAHVQAIEHVVVATGKRLRSKR